MKFFLLTFVLFSLFLNLVNSDEKIVFVDMNKIISTSNPGSSIFKQLTDINKKNLSFLKKEEKKFKEKEKKLISQKNIVSETVFKNKVDELKSEINFYNQNRDKIISDFNKTKVDSTNKLLKLVNPILAKYSIDNEISIILQKKDLVIGKKELDITDEIIKMINDQIKDFKIR